jgi:hypothetical protein
VSAAASHRILLSFLMAGSHPAQPNCELSVPHPSLFTDNSRSDTGQQSIGDYIQHMTKPSQNLSLPVTKDGIQEHLLALIVTCDLVRLHVFPSHYSALAGSYLQSFCFVERPCYGFHRHMTFRKVPLATVGNSNHFKPYKQQ